MLPQGAAHIPCGFPVASFFLFLNLIFGFFGFIVKGIAKIARKLGFDYAEAVVRAFLTISVGRHS
jgi:hypothetical protein